MPVGEIQVEGLKAFQRAARKSVDRDLPKRLGQANKTVGRNFIDRWLHPRPRPEAVGRGRGAAVRPSASKREVLLRVGGAHRAGHVPYMQWGRQPGRRPGQNAPPRPFIRESVERHRDDISKLWLEETLQAMDPAFHDTEKN